MAEDSDTLRVKMLRTSGRDSETQWFEYRPAFNRDVVRLSWELDTMEVELDSPIADFLLRAGYAAPLPQGSPTPAAPVSSPKPEPLVSQPWKAEDSNNHADNQSPPPPTPSWLKA